MGKHEKHKPDLHRDHHIRLLRRSQSRGRLLTSFAQNFSAEKKH